MELLLATTSAGGWRPSTSRSARPDDEASPSCTSAHPCGNTAEVVTWAAPTGGGVVLSISCRGTIFRTRIADGGRFDCVSERAARRKQAESQGIGVALWAPAVLQPQYICPHGNRQGNFRGTDGRCTRKSPGTLSPLFKRLMPGGFHCAMTRPVPLKPGASPGATFSISGSSGLMRMHAAK